MIDLHCHILPGLDDGPADLAGALALARAAVAAGTAVIAATPHVDDGFGLDPSRFAGERAELAMVLDAEGIPLDLRAGGEIALTRLARLDDEELRVVAMGGGPWLLVECPLSPMAPPLEPAIEFVARRGYRTLLAHPERSPGLMREPERLGRLVEAGALAQVTAGSFLGQFGEPARRAGLQMLAAGHVHCLSSDAHDDVKRPPGLATAMEAVVRELPALESRTEWLTVDVPAAILAGEEAPPPPPALAPTRGGGMLGRLRRAS